MLRLLSKGSRLAYGVKYSRFYLEDLARDRVAEQRAIDELKEQQRLQNIKNLPANDANIKNFVKVRMNNGVFSVNPSAQYIQQKCWIMEPKPVEIMPKVTISATRKYIVTSIKKARDSMWCIRKMHVIDAISQLENSQKKVPKLMVRTLYNLMDHAKQRGLNPLRLWVHGCIIGKTKRYRGIRYHAKGRGCREKTDFCQVKVILYEKPEKDFFEEIGVGKCAPGVANIVRFALRDFNSYQMLSKYTGVTTARGRQQQRMIFKRKVQKVMIENEQSGKYEPKKMVQARLREQEGQRMRQKFAGLHKQDFSNVKMRERMFKKNMQK